LVRPYTMDIIIRMEVLCTLCIVALLYFNMWMHTIGKEHVHQYMHIFSILIVLAFTITTIATLVMAIITFIAVRKDIRPRQVRAIDILTFPSMFKRNKPKLSNTQTSEDTDQNTSCLYQSEHESTKQTASLQQQLSTTSEEAEQTTSFLQTEKSPRV